MGHHKGWHGPGDGEWAQNWGQGWAGPGSGHDSDRDSGSHGGHGARAGSTGPGDQWPFGPGRPRSGDSRGGRSRGGHGGPPPWVAGLFGLAQQSRPPRGPRARRGDVRAAILAVLAEEPRNGYQIITEITERSAGAWKPSPGSVYPTLQQLEDEGLVETVEDAGRKSSRLTAEGRAYVEANPEEIGGVWEPFERAARAEQQAGEYASLKPEIGQVMNAAWQIITTGTDHQRREAIKVLVEARKGLYGILADGDPGPATDGDDDGDDAALEGDAGSARDERGEVW